MHRTNPRTRSAPRLLWSGRRRSQGFDLLDHSRWVNIGRRYRSAKVVSELLTKMFFGGFVRMHVLYHAVKEPIFGVEMMEELGRHGYDVGAGTLYTMLHQLEEAG